MNINQLRNLADRLAEEPDPDYKDEWERGYDAGQMAAGRELQALLNAGEPGEASIDREALRIANADRQYGQLRFLGSLNPDSQAHYRTLARQNLGAAK